MYYDTKTQDKQVHVYFCIKQLLPRLKKQVNLNINIRGFTGLETPMNCTTVAR